MPNGVPVIFPQRGLSDNVFDYCAVLERATEVHCMDSAFRHLVDILPPRGQKRVLHHYVKNTDVPSRHPWVKLVQ